MPAVQHSPLSLNPNKLDLQLVATYPRRIQATIERAWENVRDWEHLPHLHDSSFNYCELDESGDWGWRVWSDAEHSGYFELVIDAQRYVVRTYVRGAQVSEIWTQLVACGDATDIRVEFYAAGVTDDNREDVGAMYLGLYQVLWDEDEAMMRERQRRLDSRRDVAAEVNLGNVDELRANAPVRFELKRREYVLSESSGGWVALPTICPHLLGPLEAGEQAGQMRCPWHGYVFDLQTGRCVSPKNARCTVGLPPQIMLRDGALIAVAG